MYHSASNVIHHYLVVDDDEMTDLLFYALSLPSLFFKKQDGYINSWFKWKKKQTRTIVEARWN